MDTRNTVTTQSPKPVLPTGQPRRHDSLTEGERKVLEAFKTAIQQHEHPTLREIAVVAEVSHPTVLRNLVRLADKGYVTMNGKSRGIRLVSKKRGAQ